ncbi:hypothetical protein C486_01689 [Natrinema gari JCM 14663]|uniref:Uncharacterized protein n=1 Tax=Natrinema gari JCM 14663 TaxID=1230459 RepID=L9ZBW5_9EURY|nr:hypothetical protein C486_01689 [Natrinema gari JCM 14663]
MDDEGINNAWKRHFHPEYEETPHIIEP